MRNKHNNTRIIISVMFFASITAALLYNHFENLYDEKYDAYYAVQKEEYINDAALSGDLKLIVDINTIQTEYHSLGTDISMVHTCNGKRVTSGDAVFANSTMTFHTTITEHDSIDDVGECKVSISLPPYSTKRRVTITVHERGGRRYADAYATWEVVYSLTPDLSEMPPIKYWDVVFS